MQGAAAKFDRRREQWENAQILMEGFSDYLANCEGEARMNGSPDAEKFKLVGLAVEAVGIGMAHVIALPAPASKQSTMAGRLLFGLIEPEEATAAR